MGLCRSLFVLSLFFVFVFSVRLRLTAFWLALWYGQTCLATTNNNLIKILTCDHRFLCLILSLSFKWKTISVPPGIIHDRRPPYGVDVFFGWVSHFRCPFAIDLFIIQDKWFHNILKTNECLLINDRNICFLYKLFTM